MKLFFLFSLFSFISESNAQWVQVNSGTTSNLYEVHFPTSSTGYAVGYGGTILHSMDTGNTWQAISSPKNLDWHSVHFLNENTGFIGGDSNYFFRTDNGGNSWTAITTPQEGIFRSIFFTDTLNGYAGGGDFGETLILKTTDGGTSWNPSNVDTLADRPVTSIFFPTADTGYAVMLGYSSSFLKTTDGGNTWTLRPIQLPNFLSNLESVFFTDGLTGYIGGWYNQALIKTTDGGNNWQYLDSVNNPQLYSIFFTDENKGYAAGWYGIIKKTTDAGNTWQQEPGININQILYSVFFTKEGNGIVVGDSGYIFKKTNPVGTIIIEDETEKSKEFIVYPNPNDGKFSIRITNLYEFTKYELKFFNVLGEIIYQSKIRNTNFEIDLNQKGSGVYYVQLISENKVITKKVLVE